MKKKITLSILITCSIIYFGQAQCDSETTARYNLGDFPFTSTSGVEVTMSGANSGALGPYTSRGCSPASTHENSIALLSGNDLTLSFSKTIYEISIVLGVINPGENGTITTNNGIPTISANCDSTIFEITGNAFEQKGAVTSIVAKITIPNGATSITINALKNTIPTSNGAFTVDVLDCISITSLSLDDITLNSNNLSIHPNPSTNFITISGLTKAKNYKIYNVIGAEVKKGIVLDNGKIEIKDFTNGIYFLKIQNGNAVKFIKE